MTLTAPASITIERRVEWPDTDAAGHYHHATVIRWVEAAESLLLDRLGLSDLPGIIPRVRYEVDYTARLWLGDIVSIKLVVARIGTCSMRYDFTVTRDRITIAGGALTVVHTATNATGAAPWQERVRTALGTSARVPGECLAVDSI